MVSQNRVGKDLRKFIDASPTPYHTVNVMSAMFLAEGFLELRIGDAWELKPENGYFVANNGSIIAFIVGNKPLEIEGCKIIAAHTDSPNLRLKPKMVSDRSGYMVLNVEPYGDVLLNTWLEKDLSVAGVALVRERSGEKRAHLLHPKTPITRISQLAIHLNRTVNETGLIVSSQAQMLPVIGLTDSGVVSEKRFEEFLRKAAGVFDSDTVLSWDLSLYDTQTSAFGGLNQ
ncbi:MAG: hypothetical protein HYT94_04960 [Parcubacteria group bacterium]|nr:hypothetical protein [Parcubacteria group bacterium]